MQQQQQKQQCAYGRANEEENNHNTLLRSLGPLFAQVAISALLRLLRSLAHCGCSTAAAADDVDDIIATLQCNPSAVADISASLLPASEYAAHVVRIQGTTCDAHGSGRYTCASGHHRPARVRGAQGHWLADVRWSDRRPVRRGGWSELAWQMSACAGVHPDRCDAVRKMALPPWMASLPLQTLALHGNQFTSIGGPLWGTINNLQLQSNPNLEGVLSFAEQPVNLDYLYVLGTKVSAIYNVKQCNSNVGYGCNPQSAHAPTQ
jgi:hypothetical protein